jgi:hypothetical protein
MRDDCTRWDDPFFQKTTRPLLKNFSFFSHLKALFISYHELVSFDLSQLRGNASLAIFVARHNHTLASYYITDLIKLPEHLTHFFFFSPIGVKLDFGNCQKLKNIEMPNVSILTTNGFPTCLETLSLPHCNSLTVHDVYPLVSLQELCISSEFLKVMFCDLPKLTRLYVIPSYRMPLHLYSENVLYDSFFSAPLLSTLIIHSPMFQPDRVIILTQLRELILKHPWNDGRNVCTIPTLSHLKALKSFCMIERRLHPQKCTIHSNLFPPCLEQLALYRCAVEWDISLQQLSCLKSIQADHCTGDYLAWSSGYFPPQLVFYPFGFTDHLYTVDTFKVAEKKYRPLFGLSTPQELFSIF